jgi:hypothetical protein
MNPETTEVNETTKLDIAKSAASTIVLFASAAIAAKGLWDLGVDMKESNSKYRARKKAAKNEE